ncbi:zf-HC2 domain-containing protein [Amycolatopsis suaedae]|uniref:zf-HC2 domain-containing protein n=1 Tax=Amycolatopsis suaedae TaxID=2510978 RepID=UPI001F114D18|nr:zf-HC2 domain-containing protein [Amycolatopsis suaedae]
MREAVSATLDDEDPGVPAERIDEHLAGCAACREWRESAIAVTRLARLSTAGTPPSVGEHVFAGIGRPKRVRRRDRLRAGLVFAAVAQLSVVVSQLLAPHLAQQSSAGHLGHETAAFNFAVAMAMLFVAWRPNRAGTQLPVLLSFTAILAVLSIVDLLSGAVGWYRLSSHVPLLLGVLCTVLLGLTQRGTPAPGTVAGEPSGETVVETDAPAPPTADKHRPPAARAA